MGVIPVILATVLSPATLPNNPESPRWATPLNVCCFTDEAGIPSPAVYALAKVSAVGLIACPTLPANLPKAPPALDAILGSVGLGAWSAAAGAAPGGSAGTTARATAASTTATPAAAQFSAAPGEPGISQAGGTQHAGCRPASRCGESRRSD